MINKQLMCFLHTLTVDFRRHTAMIMVDGYPDFMGTIEMITNIDPEVRCIVVKDHITQETINDYRKIKGVWG